MKLRPHQKKDFKKIKKLSKEYQHILLGGATGYGKSALIYHIVKKAVKNNQTILVIAPRRKLIKQLAITLQEFIPSIVMGADTNVYDGCQVYIASTATMHNKLKKHGKSYFGSLDKILIDEVHINFGSASMSELDKIYWETSQWLGLSATPIDERGYRLEGWDYTHYKYQTQKLIEMGWLTPVKVMVEDAPKGLDDLKMTGGDYNEKDLASFMLDGGRVSNVYKIWKKYARNRKTMIFAVTINHANIIYNDFIEKGVKASVVHSDMDEAFEEQSLIDFKYGEVDVIINVGKLTTGYDETSVDCLIIARPTKSLRLFIQIVGRGLRLHEGKKECLILDVAGVIEEHGYPTMYRDFNKVKPEPKEKKDVEFLEMTCPNCDYSTQIKNCRRVITEKKHITKTEWFCPNCNEVLKENVVDNREVKRLKEIKDYTDVSKIKNDDVSDMVREVQKENGYMDGWVMYIAKDYKKHPEFKRSMKILCNKYRLDMINIDTVLRNINKLRDDYA